jgi:hypothetical protein
VTTKERFTTENPNPVSLRRRNPHLAFTTLPSPDNIFPSGGFISSTRSETLPQLPGFEAEQVIMNFITPQETHIGV